MVTTEFIPVRGGISIYVYEIARNLPVNYEILIVTPRRSNFTNNETFEEARRLLPPNVDIRFITTVKNTFSSNLRFQIAFARHHRKILDDFRPDIIHSQSSMPDLFVNPNDIRVPIVTTIHSTILSQIHSIKSTNLKFSELERSEQMSLLFGQLLRALEARYYAQRDYFITVSHTYADYLRKNMKIPNSTIKVIHNGVDLDEFRPSKRNDAANVFPTLSEIDRPKVLFLSRLVGIKGLHLLKESLSMVLANTDAHFIIAGSGNQKKLINGYDEHLTFVGYVPHKNTPYLYSLSDIFVLPSYHENCPLSLLEAMASGLAVIATNVGGVPEIIDNGENGIIIPNDAKELSKALIELANDKELRLKLGSEARETVEKSFSWKRAADETASYYEEVISR